jgi:hypothetical protein
MDKWFWAYAASTIWPVAVLICASLLPRYDDIWHWIDVEIERKVEDSDLAFYVAMVTAAHI